MTNTNENLLTCPFAAADDQRAVEYTTPQNARGGGGSGVGENVFYTRFLLVYNVEDFKGEKGRGREGGAERERKRERYRQTDRQRQTETERDRDREQHDEHVQNILSKTDTLTDTQRDRLTERDSGKWKEERARW